ncbi:hypothetical protein VE04_09403 [Pseudogymnoascus sp. 24MN13]|nr:hypothetical protein VE04_09403 [Pseudogymnoascus sp. 24MN13]
MRDSDQWQGYRVTATGVPPLSTLRGNRKEGVDRRRRRRGDLGAARRLCSTTDEALAGLSDAELREHVEALEGLRGAAEGVLEYWTRRTDEKLGDREAFEGVIENLVQHARKVRK